MVSTQQNGSSAQRSTILERHLNELRGWISLERLARHVLEVTLASADLPSLGQVLGELMLQWGLV